MVAMCQIHKRLIFVLFSFKPLTLVCSFSNPPSYYVDRMHTDYLSKICNENGSSLQGLEYTGGPVHICEDDHCAVVVPCVSFPGNERRHDWECGKCLTSCNIDKLLDFKVGII